MGPNVLPSPASQGCLTANTPPELRFSKSLLHQKGGNRPLGPVTVLIRLARTPILRRYLPFESREPFGLREPFGIPGLSQIPRLPRLPRLTPALLGRTPYSAAAAFPTARATLQATSATSTARPTGNSTASHSRPVGT